MTGIQAHTIRSAVAGRMHENLLDQVSQRDPAGRIIRVLCKHGVKHGVQRLNVPRKGLDGARQERGRVLGIEQGNPLLEPPL
jgi:hypothetical protein